MLTRWPTVLPLFSALVSLNLPISAHPLSLAATPTITVVSWNVESGGANPGVIAQRLAAFDGVDL